MKNTRRIPWGSIVLQLIYLYGGVFIHGYVSPKYFAVLSEFNLKIPYFVILSPLLIPGVSCAFVLFLWAWRYNRLENRLVLVLINITPIIWFCLFLYETSNQEVVHAMGKMLQ